MRWMPKTKLVKWYRTSMENADVIFIRQDEEGREYKIHGCKCYESWEQWGQPTEILGDNVDTIEKWRHNKLVKMEKTI